MGVKAGAWWGISEDLSSSKTLGFRALVISATGGGEEQHSGLRWRVDELDH